jgi:uncharacterized protein YdiU (UPF0061 family)
MKSSVILRDLDTFGLTSENTLTNSLVSEQYNENDDIAKLKLRPRQIFNVHYTPVTPEPVPKPYLISASKSCAIALGLNPNELQTEEFLLGFSGNKLLPELDNPYATIYGCHCYGTWFGQLGDGRACGIGEVIATEIDADGNEIKTRYELQLKGSGRTPFSRGFDGRAVLRSSIREYLGT